MQEIPGEKKLFSLKREGEIEYKRQKDMAQPTKSLFSLLMSRIKKTFQPSKSPDNKLNGRVQQLNQTAIVVIQKLKEVKELLKDKLDAKLFAYVEALMDPMTRDVVCVQKLLTQEGSVVHQAKAFKKYSSWMIKAELWMDLETKAHDHEAITKTIIQHTMHEADEQIDQDMQVIRDYEEHILDTLPLNEEEFALLKKHLAKEIKPQLVNLEDLKDKPELDNLHDVFAWKDEVNKKRLKYFDRALHVIDEIIHVISPSSSSEEEHEHLVEVLTQIAYLEEEIPSLLHDAGDVPSIDSVKRALVLSKMQSFEHQLHELNLNLRLTPELEDRLLVLMDTLETISKKIVPQQSPP